MGKDIVTELGVISISKDVIATLAGIATTECVGVVGVVSQRVITDGINELLGRESLSKGVDVLLKDDHLIIRVNVVIGYGNRINMIAENVIANVKYIVEKHTGLIVDHVEVHVQGVRLVD
ncbi:MAG: Asp23/Gls24 family envelope stress response protein [Firmicutes bacterium]|nr:Asp23/Gls24 family envelope stress response protein [Bacillota bacterium]